MAGIATKPTIRVRASRSPKAPASFAVPCFFCMLRIKSFIASILLPIQ
ncbi:hypothetical protein ES703_103965 [subsurface metagenome]